MIMGRRQACCLPALALLVPVLLSLACGKTGATDDPGSSGATRGTAPTETVSRGKEGTPESPARDRADTLVVRSFPPGHEVYVVPEREAETMLGEPSPQYLVGETPVEVVLDPGTYHVYVKHERARFMDDGMDNQVFTMIEGDESGWVPTARIYYITKESGHQAIVTALLWPEGQSADEFIASLPEEELFEFSLDDVAALVERHHVPEDDWGPLLSMLCKTGKGLWYGDDPSVDYLFIYTVEPGRMETQWGGTAEPGS
jgi:hypothetical protein